MSQQITYIEYNVIRTTWEFEAEEANRVTVSKKSQGTDKLQIFMKKQLKKWEQIQGCQMRI